ncbi:FUSC family protein [Bacillus tuaregi]|uniref:FUSC family protein n=1 Tax=Bacillus tuaregi TaxID=1816695 RepID=UPI0008F96249|nr:aromatic acid exporter family protein [Bacillus tuaregi]
MKLGARILKTGIAIILSLLVARLIELPSPVFAGIAAIFAVQPTIYRSYLSILEQIQGNTIGALMAVIFVLLFGNHIFIIGLAAVIVIIISLKLKLENAIGLSLVTLVAIMETPGDTFIEFALIRFLTIMLGVLSAFLVNLIFLPPKYETKLYTQISNSTTEITKWIRLNIRGASDHKLLKNDIDKLKESMIKTEQLYLMYKEERSFKKNNVLKTRKLVIYRQMINTLKRALDTLKRLHRFENEISSLPDDLQNMIQQQLDCLIHQHEHVMLKFISKVRPHVVFDEGDICLNRKELFHIFLTYQLQASQESEDTNYHLMQIITAIVDYDEYIEHLDLLITSFQSYHKEENGLSLSDDKI